MRIRKSKNYNYFLFFVLIITIISIILPSSSSSSLLLLSLISNFSFWASVRNPKNFISKDFSFLLLSHVIYHSPMTDSCPKKRRHWHNTSFSGINYWWLLIILRSLLSEESVIMATVPEYWITGLRSRRLLSIIEDSRLKSKATLVKNRRGTNYLFIYYEKEIPQNKQKYKQTKKTTPNPHHHTPFSSQ